MDAFSVNRRPRAGFTLIEMLAVVVIIGILASMIAGAAVVALRSMKVNKIKFEIAALDMALKEYKNKFGDYPPDFSNDAAVTAHLTRAFPRYQAVNPSTGTLNWKTDLANCGVTDLSGNPAAALVFWLGGMRAKSNDPTKIQLIGFSQNPRFPFEIPDPNNASTTANPNSRIGPFFDFDLSRVAYPKSTNGTPDTTRALTYLPPGANDSDPYVYFRAKIDKIKGPYYDQQYTLPYATGGQTTPSTVRACYDTRLPGVGNAPGFANASSFQIRAPGLDGRFGGGNMFPAGTTVGFPTGVGYDPFQLDDLSNFCERTFEDEIPQ